MILHKCPPFQNVAASSTAVMPYVHAGMTVVGIIFKRGGTFTNAHMLNIRLRFDGKQFVDITGPHLNAIRDYENYGAATNYDYLAFGDLQAMTQRGQMQGAIDTSIPGVKPLEMEVDIGAATSPTLEAWLVLAPPKGAEDPNKRTLRAYLKATHAPASAGSFTYPIPVGSSRGGLIHRVYAFHSNVTEYEVTKDGLFLQQDGEAAVLDFVQALRNRSNQSGLIVFDPSFTDNQTDSISTLRAGGEPAYFDHKLTVSGADTIVSYTSLLAPIELI